MSYKEYLNSTKWLYRRKKILKHDNYKCIICNKNKKLDIHHESYKNLNSKKQQPEIDDCISLCRNCHKELHNTLKYLEANK
jgi:predicted HNH restriction endonuclease